MADQLRGRTAVVTGSSRGIGLAVARALAGAGAQVVVSSRDRKAVEAAARDLEGLGGGAVAGFPCDVRDPEACAVLVERTVERFGALDVLVNNAGLGVFRPFPELTVEEFRLQVETNLCGAFYCARAAAPHLVRSGQGWIVNVGSLASRNAVAGGAGYNASKFGLLGLTEAMMLDVRQQGVRVSIVMPGSVDTDFSHPGGAGERPWALAAEDVAGAVLGLLAFPANAHVSRVEMRPTRPPVS